MKERPILFSGAMVRAILAGEKTQTRRVVKPQFGPEAMPAEMCAETAEGWQTSGHSGRWWDDCNGDADAAVYCPYGQPGDRLWVRETCRAKELSDEEARQRAIDYGDEEDAQYGLDGVVYLADNHFEPIKNTLESGDRWIDLNSYGKRKGATVPAIHMPRWASRITLEITDVRVERLQDISEADARAEGAPPSHPTIDAVSRSFGYEDFPRSWYAQLWDSINAKTAPWSSNPWVWVIEFKRAA